MDTSIEAGSLSAGFLAYIGDAVYELDVRCRLLAQGGNRAHLHREAVTRVRAGAQANSLGNLQGVLTQEEEELVRRGRNAKTRHRPRGVSARDYQLSTGLESLLGYLYLTGRRERLEEILSLLWRAGDRPLPGERGQGS